MSIRPAFLFAAALTLCLVSACKNAEEGKRADVRMPVTVVDVTVADVSWPAQYQAQASGSRAVEVRARVQGIIEKRL